MFAHQRVDSITLDGLCRYLLYEGKEICKQSLQNRFTNAAVEFMKSAVSHALKTKLNFSSVHLHHTFKRILLDDSTVFELPEEFCKKYRGSGGGASKAAIKVHYCYDLLSGSIINMINRQGIEPDQMLILPELKKGDLLIEDLGFFRIQRFWNIIQLSAYFLSRLKFGCVLYIKKEEEYEIFDLLKEERKMQPGEIRQYQIFIGKKEKLEVRLVLEKVDPKISAQKRRKLKTDKQNKRRVLSAARLRFCNLNAYITNATEQDLPMKEVRKYYSLRWQIELMFKAWKSVFKIDQVKAMKIQRFECMHYGLLMLIILITQIWIIFKKTFRKLYEVELSEFKFFKCVKEIIPILSDAIKKKKKLIEALDLLWQMSLRTCKKDQKKYKQSPYSILKLAS